MTDKNSPSTDTGCLFISLIKLLNIAANTLKSETKSKQKSKAA